jgi:hypothetical protein
LLDAQGKSFAPSRAGKNGPDEGECHQPAESIPAAVGLDRFAWDLHYEPPVKIPAAIYDGGSNPAGPSAMPGKYSVRLTVAGKSSTQPLEIVMDPRVKTSTADLQKQFDLLLKLRDRQEGLNKAVLGIRDLRAVTRIEKRFASSDSETILQPPTSAKS